METTETRARPDAGAAAGRTPPRPKRAFLTQRIIRGTTQNRPDAIFGVEY